NVHQRLSCLPADGEQLTNGNLAKAWRIESLPTTLTRQLSAKAEAKRYRTIADLLRSPFDRYEPDIPRSQIHPAAWQRARKLREALRLLLQRRNDLTIRAAELSKRGVEAYKREFGFAISAAHWR